MLQFFGHTFIHFAPPYIGGIYSYYIPKQLPRTVASFDLVFCFKTSSLAQKFTSDKRSANVLHFRPVITNLQSLQPSGYTQTQLERGITWNQETWDLRASTEVSFVTHEPLRGRFQPLKISNILKFLVTYYHDSVLLPNNTFVPFNRQHPGDNSS